MTWQEVCAGRSMAMAMTASTVFVIGRWPGLPAARARCGPGGMRRVPEEPEPCEK
jgi:hypothetical protein